MVADFLAFGTGAARQASLAELAPVRLLHGVLTDNGVEVPEGAEGTVVGVWSKGAAYEVEFTAGLATVMADQLEAAMSR